MVSAGGPGCGAGLVCQHREVEQLVSDHIEELGLVHKTVDNVLVLFLFLKCTKHPVPDTQPAPVVLIQAIPGIVEESLSRRAASVSYSTCLLHGGPCGVRLCSGHCRESQSPLGALCGWGTGRWSWARCGPASGWWVPPGPGGDRTPLPKRFREIRKKEKIYGVEGKRRSGADTFPLLSETQKEHDSPWYLD